MPVCKKYRNTNLSTFRLIKFIEYADEGNSGTNFRLFKLCSKVQEVMKYEYVKKKTLMKFELRIFSFPFFYSKNLAFHFESVRNLGKLWIITELDLF